MVVLLERRSSAPFGLRRRARYEHALEGPELLGGELGIERLLVEGGGNVNGSLMAAGVVDELSILLAPAVDGAVGRSTRSTTASCTFVTPSSGRSAR